MNMHKGVRNAPPKASAMIEALRGLGYSTPAALADIIDNSLAAKAGHVGLEFTWNGDHSAVSILDDGIGMNADQLDVAMRLGERNPIEQRSAHDLGRFWLGLKTASFSQCRRLTVASIQDGALNCLRWDLDFLSENEDGGWYLLEGPAEGSEHLLDPLLAAGKGTLVLWEVLDRIVSPGFGEQDFLDLIDIVERHLAMVFHRFLDGPLPELALSLNGKSVKPWDPFLRNHPATWRSPVERFRTRNGDVEVQCHVLPHKDHLNAQQERDAAGLHGWTAQQGFYVYRNRRLLLAGSWLGLGQGRSWTKVEAFRLARIRLDITNSGDAEWKIDIRKSTASPPVNLRGNLSRIAEDTRSRARKVFAHRGVPHSPTGKGSVIPAWKAEHTGEGIRYRINREHPVVLAVLEATREHRAGAEAMLRVIEETVPVQRIWLDTAETREAPLTGFRYEPTEAITSVLAVLYRNLVMRKNMSPSRAIEQLLHTEPFNNHPDLVTALPDKLDAGDLHVLSE